jgi:hypothetical protein
MRLYSDFRYDMVDFDLEEKEEVGFWGKRSKNIKDFYMAKDLEIQWFVQCLEDSQCVQGSFEEFI